VFPWLSWLCIAAVAATALGSAGCTLLATFDELPPR